MKLKKKEIKSKHDSENNCITYRARVVLIYLRAIRKSQQHSTRPIVKLRKACEQPPAGLLSTRVKKKKGVTESSEEEKDIKAGELIFERAP